MTRYKQKEVDYAATYGCTTRTIRAWKKQKAPLDNPLEMSKWIASRRTLPPETAPTIPPPKMKALALGEDEIRTGAAKALRRLEAEELRAHEMMDTALASGDALAIKFTREHWLRTGDSLRKYDLLVEASRRDAGELIQRETAESILTRVVDCWRIAILRGSDAIAMRAHAKRNDPVAVAEEIKTSCLNELLNSVAGYGGELMRENKWALKAMAKGLPNWRDKEETLTLRARIIQAYVDYGQELQTAESKGEEPPNLFDFMLQKFEDLLPKQNENEHENNNESNCTTEARSTETCEANEIQTPALEK